MKKRDITCPVCGRENKGLFLEETEGRFECESCGFCGCIEGYRRLSAYDTAIKSLEGKGSDQKERLTPLHV